MKKKILSLALVLAMALTLLPTAAFADAPAHKKPDGTDCEVTTDYAKVAAKTAEEIVSFACGTEYQSKDYYTCTCGSKFETATSTTPVDPEGNDKSNYFTTKGHTMTKNNGSEATCAKDGVMDTWTCSGSCSKTYLDDQGTTEATESNKVISKSTVAHTWGDTECSVCHTAKPADQSADATITNVSFNAETKTLSWTYTPAKNSDGDNINRTVSITGPTPATAGLSAGTATAGSNGAYTSVFTIPDDLADGSYKFVISDTVEEYEYTYTKSSESSHPVTPATPETPVEEDKTPSTDSSGIPVASDVTTASQADEAVQMLVNTNSTTLQERLMSSSAAVSSFVALENAVIQAKGISVAVDVDRNDAPSIVSSGVSVTGAAFNASSSVVRLVVDAPSTTYAYSAGYQISMTLTGVTNPARLAVPVIITLPKPSGIEDDQVVVLHYHDGSAAPSVIAPVVSGGSIRFMVTGFSDFVITDLNTAYGSGYSIGGYGYIGNSNNYIYNNLDALLPTIISMMGDGVFQDVPADYWAAKEIRWARDGGVMGGYADGYFRPGAATTRQQLWMVLARLAGARPADMEAARQWAIANGVSDGTNPSGALSRQQLVTMLYRYAKLRGVDVSASSKLSGYADSAKVASYAKDALSWAVAKGIVTGSNGKLNPEGTATRAHFAVFLNRFAG